jgi:voltage-gated potassium channel
MKPIHESREAFHWLRTLSHEALHRRTLRSLLYLVMIAVVGAGFLLYLVEPTITSPLAGIWYAWVTVTHVGYGDVVASSFLGRLLSSVLILIGVGFFALAAGIFASILVAQDMRSVGREMNLVEDEMADIENAETRILVELQTLNRRMTALENQLKKTAKPATRKNRE